MIPLIIYLAHSDNHEDAECKSVGLRTTNERTKFEQLWIFMDKNFNPPKPQILVKELVSTSLSTG